MSLLGARTGCSAQRVSGSVVYLLLRHGRAVFGSIDRLGLLAATQQGEKDEKWEKDADFHG